MHGGLSSKILAFLGRLDREIAASLNKEFSITSALQYIRHTGQEAPIHKH